jgi:hypothetical protein
MLIRTMVAQSVVLACLSAFSLSQQAQAPSARPALHEFPLTLQQSLESGKAAIGTKVQAKLAIADKVPGQGDSKECTLFWSSYRVHRKGRKGACQTRDSHGEQGVEGCPPVLGNEKSVRTITHTPYWMKNYL